jgi:hypothetical protein
LFLLLKQEAIEAVTMLKINNTYPSMDFARDTINRYVIDQGESYQKQTSNPHQYGIRCRGNSGCKFSVKAMLQQSLEVKITALVAHSCNPRTHYGFQQVQNTWYLMPHHRESVNFNREITVKQIMANEHEHHNNVISYQSAHRTKQALLLELDGYEAENFGQLEAALDLLIHPEDPDSMQAYSNIEYDDTNRFKRYFVLPVACGTAWQSCRPFIAVDACHCTSKYRQTLMIAAIRDGNDEILPLA